MTPAELYPSDATSFARMLGGVERALQTDLRLPDWPFRASTGHADICQFSLAIEGPFGAVLQALADAHGDASVSLVALEPSPDYYRDSYGSYPGFVMSSQSLAQNYWEAVSYEPGGDPTGSLAYTANVVSIAGSTGEWAVWAERSWDLAIVLTQRARGAWTSVGVNFVLAAAALADFTEPDFKLPLQDQVRLAFLDNVRFRGTLR